MERMQQSISLRELKPAGKRSDLGHRRVSLILPLMCSFEFVFVLFLFAGRYKADPRLQWVPVDITALFFGLSVVCAAYILIRRGFRFQRRALHLLVFFAAFAAYAALSLLWTPGTLYASEKALYIATLTSWSLVGTAIIIARDRRRMARFFLVLVLFSLWVAIEAIFNYLHSRTGSLEPTFVTALGDNYLGVGRVLGIGALITLAYLLFVRTLAVKGLCLILLCLFLGVLFLAGGRGPLAATVLAALVALVAGWRMSASKVLYIRRYVLIFMVVAVLIGASVVYLLATDNPTITLTRFLLLLGPGLEASANQRVDYYEASIPLWIERPIFGHGIGSWPILMGLGDFRGYPHNIALEVMVELGLLGLLLLIGILVYAIRSLGDWRSIRNDPVRILILMLFTNTFINACVSGDIPDNRLMFGMLGLMVFAKTVMKKRP